MPLLLLNLSLPIDQRVKRDNIILLGHIPGPKQPLDLDSFLRPMIEEFRLLNDGILMYQGCTQTEHLIRAYITLIGADMPAREKLLGKLHIADCTPFQ